MKKFDELSTEEIAKILNTAMDSGDWHTPFAHDINLHQSTNPKAAYGWCNISKHNTFRDKPVWFNINANTVQIWEERYVKGKANECIHRPIYNVKRLSEILSEFEPIKSNP